MATKNSVNNKAGSLTLDPGASGDPFVQLSIAADDKFIYGVDDSDSDKFKIADANSLATANVFVMTAAGERTLPLLPAFLAYNSSTDSNVVGGSTTVVVIEFDTEIFDQGGDYNNSTDTFTAPVTGRYRFAMGVRLDGVVAANRSFFDLNTSNRNYQFDSRSPVSSLSASGSFGICSSLMVDMDAADTAFLRVLCTGEASDIVDVYGGSSPITFFSGYLVC